MKLKRRNSLNLLNNNYEKDSIRIMYFTLKNENKYNHSMYKNISHTHLQRVTYSGKH
jgi:hypothetical protein